jgi:hypothetical protein
MSYYKYNEIKQVISGCNTIQDAYNFMNMYLKRNPEMRDIATSIVNGKNYDKYVDFDTMKNILSDINNCEYQEDAIDIIGRNFKTEINQLQMKAFTRIANCKPIRPDKKDTSYYNKTNNMLNNDSSLVTKKCPHCHHDCISCDNTTYIICGYQNIYTGFDMIGCGRDWCFRCGKKLCKQWHENSLFIDINRIHNDECCKVYAEQNNFSYPEDFCQCIKR